VVLGYYQDLGLLWVHRNRRYLGSLGIIDQDDRLYAETGELMRCNHIITAACAVLTVSMIALGIIVDRLPPISFISSEILPSTATPGETVTAQLFATYYRLCQAQVTRDLIGSDKVIHTYAPHWASVPGRKGEQEVEIPFQLPAKISSGKAIYQAMLVFRSCGITSRLFPIVIYTPEAQVYISGG
jgi:hypothetical protein